MIKLELEKYNIDKSWYDLFTKWSEYIDYTLEDVYNTNSTIKTYPNKYDIFKAFMIPITDIKIVLLGQDVYHGEGQAMGLSFSVPLGIKIPPSLVNIFKEIQNEFPERNYNFTNGNLTKWSIQEGIMLLNSGLTVKQSSPLSHIKKWEKFTNYVIEYILQHNSTCIFLLLGNYAKKKINIIKDDNRYIYEVHPSPLSAYNGFFNSSIFINLEKKLKHTINWQN